MRGNHLLLPFLCSVLAAVACAATADERKKFVRVITEPKPGEEYVSIHTAKPASGVQGRPLDTDIDVNVQDEGQTGIKDVTGPVPAEEKIYAHKKLYPSVDNEDGPRRTTKPEKKHDVRMGGAADEIGGADGVVTKPNNRDETREPAVAKAHAKTSGEDDGLYDFVDSPYGGQIVGAASSQASRINIKKAPNGQEYEYEYVYYYYDEDDEHAKSAATGSKTVQTSTVQPLQQTTLHGGLKVNNKDAVAGSKSRKPPVVQDENQFVQNNNKGRFSTVVTTDEPEGHSNFAVNDIAEHSTKTKESGRNLEEALSVPSSSPSVSEERLPHNPRFPLRPRGNSKPAQEFATTVIPATDTPITHIRASNVHQPGLDLVDSNAFRTHSGNNGQLNAAETSPRNEINNNRDAVVQTTTSATADQVATTIINNAYNTQPTDTVPSATETVGLDRNQDDTDADAKGLSATTTLTPDEVVAVTTQRYTAGPTDKGAVDLYAILQRARGEETANTIAWPAGERATRPDDGETQLPTTTQRPATPAAVAAITTTAAATATTPAAAATATTAATAATATTATPAPTRQFHGTAAGPARGRYRGNGANRHASSSAAPTTSTVESPSASPDEVTERRKFKPNRERNTQGSVYSKRYQSSTAALDKEPSITESEAVVTKAQKPSFGRQRTRASKPVSSTLPIDETVEVTSAAPKPNFAERSNLRRQNSRNKFTTSGSTTTTTTTTAAAPQVAEEEEGVEHDVSESTSTTTAKPVGSRLRPNIRPLRPGLRLNFGGKGSTTTASPAVPSTTQSPAVESSPDATDEKEPVQQEAVSPTPTPDSLTRLKNRSRFRVPDKQSSAFAPKQQTLAPPAGSRKHLLSNLLPKKKSIAGPTEEPSAAVVEDAKPVSADDEQPENDRTAESQNEDDERPSSHAPGTTTSGTTEAPPPASSTNRLSSLLAKRRPLQRRPADLQQQQSGGKQSANHQQEE